VALRRRDLLLLPARRRISKGFRKEFGDLILYFGRGRGVLFYKTLADGLMRGMASDPRRIRHRNSKKLGKAAQDICFVRDVSCVKGALGESVTLTQGASSL